MGRSARPGGLQSAHLGSADLTRAGRQQAAFEHSLALCLDLPFGGAGAPGLSLKTYFVSVPGITPAPVAVQLCHDRARQGKRPDRAEGSGQGSGPHSWTAAWPRQRTL